MTEEEVEYVCCAVEAVAENGWRMLPQYRYDHETGEWSHRSRLNKFPNRVWISRAFQEMADGGAACPGAALTLYTSDDAPRLRAVAKAARRAGCADVPSFLAADVPRRAWDAAAGEGRDGSRRKRRKD